MAAALTLTSRYDRATRSVVIDLTARVSLESGWRLAFTSITPLTPGDAASCELTDRLSTYHVVEARPPVALAAGDAWSSGPMQTGHRPCHANDGPAGAYVVTADGSTVAVDVEPMTTNEADPAQIVATGGRDVRPPLVPFPRALIVRHATRVGTSAAFRDGAIDARRAFGQVAALEERLRGTTALRSHGELPVDAREDPALAPAAYRLRIAATGVDVEAASVDGFRFAFITLAQLLAGGAAAVDIEDHPRHSWRGLHIDLARRWYEPATVERILDLAAWRKLGQLHLHLTDDEGWRLPVDEIPALAEIGGRRGHGLPLPPMLGDGAGPTGRAYTAAEIARWVERAAAVGITMVPEVDVPGHVHAALTALPELRDPDDRSQARSVQGFVDNVLVPGRPATTAFLERVVDTLARLFPTSPWIHIGGDEVAEGAWSGSPAVDAFRAGRGLASTREVEGAFHRDLVASIRARTGRLVGAWQEAAESGGVLPGDGYVVGWRTADDCRRLAARGYDVVLSPGWPYYLDMAPDARWSTPGLSWAGTATLDDVCGFEPGAGWSEAERSHVLGIQACLWSEVVDSPATFDRLVFPRLDAIAERAWRGRIEGGVESLRARAASLPRLGTT